MNNPIRRIKPDKTGVNAPLGDLEQAVMRRVWDSGQPGITAAELQSDLDKHHSVALTTVLTTFDRLRDKGIVRREREGKAYRYWAAIQEDELQKRIVGGVLDRLIAQFPKAVAAYFAQQEPEEVEPGTSLEDLAKRVHEIRNQQSKANEE